MESPTSSSLSHLRECWPSRAEAGGEGSGWDSEAPTSPEEDHSPVSLASPAHFTSLLIRSLTIPPEGKAPTGPSTAG